MDEQKAAPPGMVGVMIVNEDQFKVGISPEMPNHLLLVLPEAGVAIAFSLDKEAELLHDRVCALLGQVLESEEPNPEMAKRRLDN